MRRHHDHIRALGLGASDDFPGRIANSHYAFYVEMGERRWKEVTKPPLRKWLRSGSSPGGSSTWSITISD
jgi:hypothetical protein